MRRDGLRDRSITGPNGSGSAALPDSGGSPLLRIRDVHKTYPPNVRALRAVSLDIMAGEVTALLGANGAGKSTLARILTGVERPTSGALYLDGAPIALSDAEVARRHGIAAVYQELPLLPNLSAAENVTLGHTGRAFLSLWSPRPARRIYRDTARAIPNAPGPDVLVGGLSVAQRQKVAFIRALSMDPRLLIVDEGTSSLTFEERREMQGLLRRLAVQKRIAVIYITHFIEDALSGADRIVALRDGGLAFDRPAADTRHSEVLAVLGGSQVLPPPAVSAAATQIPPAAADRDLHVEQLLCDGVDRLSFNAASGECLGLYGPPGCGATEALRAIAGLGRHGGRIVWRGESLPGTSAARVARHVVYCNGDRARNLILPWTVGRNIDLLYLFRHPLLAIPSRRAARDRAHAVVAAFAIKGSPEEPIRNLSGGNQQRVAVARALSLGTPLLLLGDDLTRGVDIVGRGHIHALLRSASQRGATVVIYSTDPEELTQICDRVLVLQEGRVVGELGRPGITVPALEGAIQRRRHAVR